MQSGYRIIYLEFYLYKNLNYRKVFKNNYVIYKNKAKYLNRNDKMCFKIVHSILKK